MLYPPNIFIRVDKNRPYEQLADIRALRKKFNLEVVVIGRDPNDIRSRVIYKVVDVRDFNSIIELSLQKICEKKKIIK
jgi:hypothetical protein